MPVDYEDHQKLKEEVKELRARVNKLELFMLEALKEIEAQLYTAGVNPTGYWLRKLIEGYTES